LHTRNAYVPYSSRISQLVHTKENREGLKGLNSNISKRLTVVFFAIPKLPLNLALSYDSRPLLYSKTEFKYCLTHIPNM